MLWAWKEGNKMSCLQSRKIQRGIFWSDFAVIGRGLGKETALFGLVRIIVWVKRWQNIYIWDEIMTLLMLRDLCRHWPLVGNRRGTEISSSLRVGYYLVSFPTCQIYFSLVAGPTYQPKMSILNHQLCYIGPLKSDIFLTHPSQEFFLCSCHNTLWIHYKCTLQGN